MTSRTEIDPRLRWAAAAIATMAIPPTRALLESSMTLHMLVQLPILGLTGFVLGLAWRDTHAMSGFLASMLRLLQTFNRGGVTGLVFASFVMVWWMLPRGLDIARLDPGWDAAKFLTVALAGMAIAISWSRVHPVVKGVVHVEVIATFLRFGWAYMSAPSRLCLSYLDGDQVRAGALLLACGALYAVGVIWRPLFGTSCSALVQHR